MAQRQLGLRDTVLDGQDNPLGGFLIAPDYMSMQLTTSHNNFKKLKSVKVKEGANTSFSEDEALAYLAKVLVEAYFKQKRYDRTKQPQ